jgi:hypothetical protein
MGGLASVLPIVIISGIIGAVLMAAKRIKRKIETSFTQKVGLEAWDYGCSC